VQRNHTSTNKNTRIFRRLDHKNSRFKALWSWYYSTLDGGGEGKKGKNSGPAVSAWRYNAKLAGGVTPPASAVCGHLRGYGQPGQILGPESESREFCPLGTIPCTFLWLTARAASVKQRSRDPVLELFA
jgi:hypothetical protein